MSTMAKRRRRHIVREEDSDIETPLSETADISPPSPSNEDFISRLPNGILTHILSYINTRSAVATSVLSKRWNNVWISVPNLDFNFYPQFCTCPVKKAQFDSFVDRVLSLNNVLSVRKVNLSIHNDCELSRVTRWISSLFKRDAVDINITLPRSYLIDNLDPTSRIYSIPNSFFIQKNLVRLYLEHAVLEIPPLVCFPCLETLSLDHVQLLDDDSMKNLLSGCPVLKSLFIKRPLFDNAQTLYVCTSTLRYFYFLTDYRERNFGYEVVIDAPNVNELNIQDMVGVNYHIINLSSLVKAELLVEEDDSVSSDDFEERLLKLLRKISHVEELKISTGLMRSLEYVTPEELPMFNKLTRLKVDIFNEDSWPILPPLFHHMPNLVTLKIENDEVHPHCAWYDSLEVPRCFLSSIEDIEISSFEECDEEMEMVSYILKNAMVLKNLSIYSWGLDFAQETNIMRYLLTLPRSSAECQVTYENYRDESSYDSSYESSYETYNEDW